MKPVWWSWQQILSEIPSLGIPHFQRGQVWGRGNQVALLESIYEASPCGSFVLWQPENPTGGASVGVPLCEESKVDESAMTWLVDGQQRTRTLLGVYRDMLNAKELLGQEIYEEIRGLLDPTFATAARIAGALGVALSGLIWEAESG